MNKIILFLIVLSSFVCLIKSTIIFDDWKYEDMKLEDYESDKLFYLKFYKVFNKNYSKEETIKSSKILYENIDRINKHNSNSNVSYKIGVNQFTDRSLEELSEVYLDMDMKNKMKLRNLREENNYIKNSQNNFSPIDWRTHDIFTEIRDQGECGSCWAFATLGTIEALRNKIFNINKYLSVQQLIDCDTKEKGCKGGWPSIALNYIAKSGIVADKDYPYVAQNGNCHNEIVESKIECKINSRFERCEEEECLQNDFQYNLLKNGPVTIVIDAYNTNFFNYKSGIYDEKCGEPNHAVMLVGYGVDSKGVKYWIIRNSWGIQWGMDGYGYVKFDSNNYLSCNINRYGFQPKVLE